MAFKCGGTIPGPHCQNELEDDSNEEEEDEEDDDVDELDEEDDDVDELDEEDDDVDELDDEDIGDIKEINENVNQDKLSPLVKQFGKSLLSSDSGCSKQKLAINGSFSLGLHSNSHKFNGARELSTRYHGTTNCNLRREQTDKLKRRPLLSNPPTEVELLFGRKPEVVALEGDGIEILSESPNSKSATSQNPFCSSVVKSPSKSSASDLKKAIVEKLDSFSSNFYTANEVVRLQEKAEYQLLLEKYVKGSPYQPICKKPDSDVELKNDPRTLTTRHFEKEVLQQPIDSFIEKYYRPCQLLPRKTEKEPPPEITIEDDDDDKNEEEEDVQIVGKKLPEYKAVFTTPLFSNHWLSEFQEHLRAQTEERNKIVEDYERKLEKIKREMIIRRRKAVVPVSKPIKPIFPAD